MEENQSSKQPQIPEPTKTPKRVVRTYQEDLARMSKDLNIEVDQKNEKPKKKKGLVTPPKPKTPAPAPKKPEVPKPTQAPTLQEAVLEETNIGAEEKKHYVEEIQATDSIDLDAEASSFTQADLDHVGNLGKKQAPKPTPAPKPLPKKEMAPKPKTPEPIVVTENASAPKQNFFGGVMAWLLGGDGSENQPAQAPEPAPLPKAITTPPKKLEGVPVVPNVPKKEEEPEPPAKPQPAPAPQEPQELPPIKEEKPLPKPSSNLFAPPAPKAPEPPKPVVMPKPEPTPIPAPQPLPLPEKPKTEFKAPSPITTYTSDARKGIKQQKETPLSVLAKQQDAKKAPPKKQQPKKSGTPVLVLATAFLLLGVGAIVGAYFFLQSDPTPVATPQRVVTPVFAENRTKVSATATPRLDDLNELVQMVSTPAPETLTHITFQAPGELGPELIPFSEILLASNEVPGTLARAVYPQSMFGVYGDTKEPVLVLAVTSFERSFKSLLSWESDMSEDLAPLFGTLNTERIATSTPPYIEAFVDEEIETTDARILYDAVGDTHLIYGFITPNILFITQTKETFIELADRIVRE